MLSAKNCCFWSVMLGKTLESPLGCKEIQSVNPKGNQPWIIIGRTDAEAEAPILGPPHVKSWLVGKDPDAGKDWGQEKGTTEDEMVDGITDLMDINLSKLREIMKDSETWLLQFIGLQRVRHNWTTELNGIILTYSKDWCWSWNSNTLATCYEELTRWKRPWCWKDWR